jgi:hypothetical protein
MTHARVRRACVAALACTLLALLPATAGGHPVDCDGSSITAAPAGDRFDWTVETFLCPNGARRAASDGTADGSAQSATVAAGDRRRGSLKQVGHEPLKNRGMNAAIAIHEDYAYVGSRTDGGHAGQPQGGLMVVDISDPSDPDLAAGPLDPKAGESTRELRVWQSQEMLIVLNTNCGVGDQLHHCTQPSISNIRFYDVSRKNAKRPKLIREFGVDTHEFFLWEDPKNAGRALVFAGNAGSTCMPRGGAPSCPFSVWDISAVPNGGEPVTLYSGSHTYTRFPAEPAPVEKPAGGLHSLTVSNDGSRAYFALLTGGFAVVDTSDFASGAALPQPKQVTANEARPVWSGPGAHSAVKLWGRDTAWVSDEVYGTATAPGHGCPWGWTRMIDISDEAAPQIKGEYREPENDPDSCATWNPPRTSYSAHNPTLTPHVAFSTWHSGGLQAVSLENPNAPSQLAEWEPKPLRKVLLEDPRLSSDPDTGRNEKVVLWSYAIIDDGLIYVVDLRNGLYVLKYRGAFEDEVRGIEFLDGNSNQGDALCFEPVGRKPRHCR